jgi:colanic acid/amylovoran biosynthesis glycosyltransferase
LSDIRPLSLPKNPAERFSNSLRFRWWHHVDPALRGVNERRVRSYLERHGVRAVLAEYGPEGCLLRLACKRAQTPLYVHFHGYDATSLPRDSLWRRSYRQLFRDAAGIIAPSSFIADRLEAMGCARNKLHVSACGIDVPAAPASFARQRRFVAVGRLVEKKSPLSTLRAFALVARRDPKVRLDIVGDGPLRERCIAAVSDLGLVDCVTFHGALPNERVMQLLSNSFAFVQHSVEAPDGDCEGLPVAILEAMACALPVISTRHSGIPDAVLHGETGLLVAEHDIDGMAGAMMAVLGDPEMAARMGRAGRDHVESAFTRARTAARLREIMGLAC